jgi:hypothetical protein
VAALLTAVVFTALTGGGTLAQAPMPGYFQTDPPPYPPFNDRLQDGGLFIAGEYVMWRQMNPLKPQLIAIQGFTSTSAETGFPIGTFVGNALPALDVRDVTGEQFSPGYKYEIGYRFQDGSVLSISDFRLFNANKTSGATFARPDFQVGANFENSFLFAPVFNFPPEFSGPPKVLNTAGTPSVGGAIGIWNGASIMTEKFSGRTEIWDLTYRLPSYFETETCRLTGSVGFRYFKLWESFQWTSIDIDLTTGTGGALNTAVYTQISSNNLWGPFISHSWEQYIGKGFGWQFDLGAAILLDIVRERAKFEVGAKDLGTPEGKKARSDFTIAPELTGSLALVWYPYQGVQLRAGYNVIGLFNTVASENPVAFNFAAPDPKFNRFFARYLDGFDVGVAFIW